MAEENHRIERSIEAANWIQVIGLLKGVGLGALLALPVAIPLGIIGAWLDASKADSEWLGGLLAASVIEVGGFCGAFWMAQTAAMRNWPDAYRQVMWKIWRRAVGVALLVALPIAGLIGWWVWQTEGSWSDSLGGGLLIWMLSGLMGVVVAYVLGDRRIKELRQQVGAGWGGGAASEGLPNQGVDSTNITERIGVEAPSNIQPLDDQERGRLPG